MLLTKKLLSFINRVFDKDPGKFLAFRLGYDGGMSWRVEEAFLYTTVDGGVGQDLAIDLSQHTIAGLVGYLASQPGYSVRYIDGTDLAQLSARVLLDASNNISNSNGDHIYGYTSVLWAYLEAAASELKQAQAAIVEMLKQMSTRTARDIWLDEVGGFYGIPRLAGEQDTQYGPRIIAEVLRPRENNVAMEAAIKIFTGQDATVTDVVEWTPDLPMHDGSITHDGTSNYVSSAKPRYGLFDVEYGYDLLNGGDFTGFQGVVRDLIGRLRAAGTHLRALALKGSAMQDSLAAPTDAVEASLLQVGLATTDDLAAPTEATTLATSMSTLSDTLDGALDGLAVVLSTQFTYSGLRTYDGAITHRGISTSAEDIGTPGDIPFSGVLTLDGSFNLDSTEQIDGLI